MNIEDLQLIVETIYQHNPSAYKRGGDVELLNSHIKAMQHLKEVNKIHYKEYNLTDLEALSIVILEGFGSSRFIQEPLYNRRKLNALTEVLIQNLDSALRKAPKNTHPVLYANDGFMRGNNRIGDIFTVNGFFTTSIDDFDNAHSIKWIIEPLPEGQTKAHEIYKIYNHGEDCPYPEYQVEFERVTKFEITDIKKGKEYNVVHIKELPSQTI